MMPPSGFTPTKKMEPQKGPFVLKIDGLRMIKNKQRALDCLPIPETSIYLQFDISSRVILPFKSKHIHYLQKGVFLNTSYNISSRRKLALAKNVTTDYSKKPFPQEKEKSENSLTAAGNSFLSG